MEPQSIPATSAPVQSSKLAIFKKKSTWIVIVVVIILIVLGYLYRRSTIAATVNGSVITKSEVDSILEKEYGKQALDSLVSKKLVTEEIKKQKIVVTQDEINAEVAKVEKQMVAQGGTLDQFIEMQGITRADVLEQITIQKQLEKLMAPKVTVTAEEVDAAIKTNKLTATAGQTPEAFKEQVKAQLTSQKIGEATQTWLSGLKTAAKITTYAKY